MNRQKENLKAVAGEMSKLGMEIPRDVELAIEELENPVYKVAVVGKFQTGKSHLINEAFLNQSLLLKEGNGLCTTAVSTEIAFGATPRLVIDYKDDAPTKIIENPNAEDIQSFTGADDETARIELAANVKNVRLEWPCESLKHFTLIDTAGIDDPNRELLRATTYRTIPDSDAAVMVVSARALSAVELNFLRQSIFSCGLGHVMIVVSYRPETDSLSEEGRDKILETIRGQLTEIGMGDIPVRMVCYDQEITGNTVNTPEGIREMFCGFAEAAAGKNRVSKIAMSLKKIISDRIRELEFKMSLSDKDEAELKVVRAGLTRLADELRSAREELRAGLDVALCSIRDDETLRFRTACTAIGKRYYEAFGACDGLGDAQKHFEKANEILVPQLESEFVLGFESMRRKVLDELLKRSSKIAELCSRCNLAGVEMGGDLKLDGGMFKSWNSRLVTFADYLLTIFLLPGGLFMGWCVRFIWGRIPIINALVPSELIKSQMTEAVRESLDKELMKYGDHFRDSADQALARFKGDVFKQITDEIERRLKEAVDAAEAKYEGRSTFDRDAIAEKIDVCGKLLAAI